MARLISNKWFLRAVAAAGSIGASYGAVEAGARAMGLEENEEDKKDPDVADDLLDDPAFDDYEALEGIGKEFAE
ncbi:MAG TPA: hypothetical protein DF712_00145, partial [Balneola sp.]|nr:hypothetical protein [Balneola sp.]